MKQQKDSYVFINGNIVPSSEAKLSIWDRGFIYGDGFFTTMKAEKGKVFFLKEHMERLKNSCKSFKIKFPESLCQEEIYSKLLSLNSLSDRSAAVKVIITRGKKEGLGLPYGDDPTYIITVKAYIPPYEEYKKGWSLISFPFPRSCPISAHKSLNYLYNMWAKEYALSHGADDAILIDADGIVKETSVGTIVYKSNGIWFTPEAEDILSGITLKILSEIWKKAGKSIEKKKTFIKDLINASQVWVLNSLIGVMPVKKIDDHVFADDVIESANRARKVLWNYKLFETDVKNWYF